MRTSRLVAAVFILLLGALVVPVTLVHMPPLFDYPNHVARLWLIGGGAAVPPLSSIYAVEWTALTNIGIDLLAVPLTKLFSAETVGALYLALGLVLVPLGAAMLNRAIFGGLHWWCLAFTILVWNAAVLAGFLNFEIAMGVALLAAAADPALLRRGQAPAFLARVAFGALLTVIHIFGLVFYAALLCGLALGPDLRPLRSRAGLVQAAGRILPVVAAIGLVLAGFVLTAPALPGAHETADSPSLLDDIVYGFTQLIGRRKVKSAFSWIWTYSLWADVPVLAVLVAPLVLALRQGRLRVHAGLGVVFLALCLLYVVTPFRLAGTYWVDRRFVFMAPFVLGPALRPELEAMQARLAAVLLCLVSLGRTAFIGHVWELRQQDVASVERALAHVPPGSAVMPVEHRGPPMVYGPLGRYFSGGEPSYGHYPALAVRERQSFMPLLFTARGKQPLRVLPPWDEISIPEGWLVTIHSLTNPEVWQENKWAAPYIRFWRERYDYILVVNADMADKYGPFVPPPGLELEADEGFAQLYRVVREKATTTAGR